MIIGIFDRQNKTFPSFEFLSTRNALASMIVAINVHFKTFIYTDYISVLLLSVAAFTNMV